MLGLSAGFHTCTISVLSIVLSPKKKNLAKDSFFTKITLKVKKEDPVPPKTK